MMPQGGARRLNTLSVFSFPPPIPMGPRTQYGARKRGSPFIESLLVSESTGQGGEGWRVNLEGQTGNSPHRKKLTQPPNVKETMPGGG